MTHRTTLALDEATIKSIRKLARTWAVSQSEAVRRAVRLAERRTEVEQAAPLERLAAYHRAGGLDRKEADTYLRKVAEDRRSWRSSE